MGETYMIHLVYASWELPEHLSSASHLVNFILQLQYRTVPDPVVVIVAFRDAQKLCTAYKTMVSCRLMQVVTVCSSHIYHEPWAHQQEFFLALFFSAPIFPPPSAFSLALSSGNVL